MSDELPARTSPSSPRQLLIDFGPVGLFIVSSNILNRFPETKDNSIFIATAIFIVATLIAIAYCRWKTGRIPPALIVVGVLVVGFGGLTLALHDDEFIKLRPTFANIFYCTAILISVLIRQNVMKLVFGHVFAFSERIWTILALRWAGFFFVMIFAAEYIRRTMSTEDWVNYHFPVLYVPTIIFALANTPFILKHNIETPTETPSQQAPSA
ncbi:MAG: septation protein IspZ [Hyphomonadaceae bacterium]|nr:septation protein IspZ [Hyphomonadaceae bacterium]